MIAVRTYGAHLQSSAPLITEGDRLRRALLRKGAYSTRFAELGSPVF